MQVLFADDYRAGGFQTGYNVRVFMRNPVFENSAGGRRPHTRSVDQIFQANWNPVQRPAPVAGMDLMFGTVRFREGGVGHNRDECVQGWIEALDFVQRFTNEFDGREFLLADEL